jgi:hypothetical protein
MINSNITGAIFCALQRQVTFWRSAFQAAWVSACDKHTKQRQLVQRIELDTKTSKEAARRLKQIEESYCDAGLQLLALDAEHQLLKLRSPTQLNKEYENQVLAVSLGRPDMSPTRLADAQHGKQLIQTVEALATSIASSFERAGLLTAPPRSPQARLLEELRNLFDGCGILNWPVHAGRIADQSRRVQRISEFSGMPTTAPIDV